LDYAPLPKPGCGESCPIVPGRKREDWDLEDPKGKSLNRVREIRDEIRAKVRALIKNEGFEPPSRTVLPLSHAPWREELPKKFAKIGIVDSTRIRVLRLERGYDEPRMVHTASHALRDQRPPSDPVR
jgi:hypothetical protein